MEKITSRFLRKKFLEFFENRGHAVIKSASLIPENDPSVLFTTAGMHPLIPYFWDRAILRVRGLPTFRSA